MRVMACGTIDSGNIVAVMSLLETVFCRIMATAAQFGSRRQNHSPLWGTMPGVAVVTTAFGNGFMRDAGSETFFKGFVTSEA